MKPEHHTPWQLLLISIFLIINSIVIIFTGVAPALATTITIQNILISLLFSIQIGLGIASGIGLLRHKSWAKHTTIMFATISIILRLYYMATTPDIPMTTSAIYNLIYVAIIIYLVKQKKQNKSTTN